MRKEMLSSSVSYHSNRPLFICSAYIKITPILALLLIKTKLVSCHQHYSIDTSEEKEK